MSRGVVGHLELICAADGEGRSYLRHQSFRGPVHLSKPHEDVGALVLNLVNPTAGLFDGDRLDCRVSVESGARLVLTTPSASRAHRSRAEGAEVRQEFSVAAGGALEVWPELFIPQAGSRFRQETVLRVAPGGELLFFEALAPGRVAMGECFAFTSLEWKTELFLGEHQVARERYRLQPQEENFQAIARHFETAYFATAFAVSPCFTKDALCWESIHGLHEEAAWVGCSAWRGNGSDGAGVVKVIAAGSVLLRRKLASIRHELHAALGRTAPGLRRTDSPRQS